MNYKMIVLDLDGTLTNRDKVITEKTRHALMEAQKRGKKVVLASGRPTYGVVPLAEELELGYRTSCIPGNGYVVLEAEYALKRGEPEAIKARMDELSAKRREKQPLEYPSAGSTFKRPQGHFAGQLIQEAGLKGFTLGGAAVSEKHAGFVINQNGATASEIYGLCMEVKRRVQEQSGVELELEVKLLGGF